MARKSEKIQTENPVGCTGEGERHPRDVVSELEYKDSLRKRISNLEYIFACFQIKWNLIVVTVSLFIMNQMDFRLVHNQKENGHYDHFIINLKQE